MTKFLNDLGLNYLIGKITTALSGKVDKVTGKGLSTNDFTNDLQTKLNGIATQANKTTFKVDTTTFGTAGGDDEVIFAGGGITTVSANAANKTITISTTAPTIPEYTIVKQATAESGNFATYYLTKAGTQVGEKINIPKDYLVKSATLETCSTADTPVSGYKFGDKYLDFVINAKDNDGTAQHLYILVSDLVDTYKNGNGLNLSDNTFSVKAKDKSGITVDNNGVYVNIGSDLQFDSTTGAIKHKNGSASTTVDSGAVSSASGTATITFPSFGYDANGHVVSNSTTSGTITAANLNAVTSITKGNGIVGSKSGTIETVSADIDTDGGMIFIGSTDGSKKIAAALNSYTKNTSAIGGQLYAVQLDNDGKLAVNVPWTDNDHYVTGASFTEDTANNKLKLTLTGNSGFTSVVGEMDIVTYGTATSDIDKMWAGTYTA